jgi:hypothetical protein
VNAKKINTKAECTNPGNGLLERKRMWEDRDNGTNDQKLHFIKLVCIGDMPHKKVIKQGHISKGKYGAITDFIIQFAHHHQPQTFFQYQIKAIPTFLCLL